MIISYKDDVKDVCNSISNVKYLNAFFVFSDSLCLCVCDSNTIYGSSRKEESVCGEGERVEQERHTNMSNAWL